MSTYARAAAGANRQTARATSSPLRRTRNRRLHKKATGMEGGALSTATRSTLLKDGRALRAAGNMRGKAFRKLAVSCFSNVGMWIFILSPVFICFCCLGLQRGPYRQTVKAATYFSFMRRINGNGSNRQPPHTGSTKLLDLEVDTSVAATAVWELLRDWDAKHLSDSST